MNISVEISMYPLADDYIPPINAFLKQLRQHQDNLGDAIDIRTNNMSTRLFGDFDVVTKILNDAMKFSMQNKDKLVFVCKYLSSDTRELEDYD